MAIKTFQFLFTKMGSKFFQVLVCELFQKHLIFSSGLYYLRKCDIAENITFEWELEFLEKSSGYSYYSKFSFLLE